MAGWTVENATFSAVSSTNNSIVLSSAGIFGASFPFISQSAGALFSAVVGRNRASQQIARAFFQPSEFWPVLSRLAYDGSLDRPGFSLSLERLTEPTLSNAGVLTLGGLPSGIQESSLTWAQVYKFPPEVMLPSDVAPYAQPFSAKWEIEVDGVTINGQQVGSFGNGPVYGLVDSGTPSAHRLVEMWLMSEA